VLALVLALPLEARAIGDFTAGSFSLDATGSVRLTEAVLSFPDEAAILGQGAEDKAALGAAVLRLLAQGDISERVDYELNLFVDLTWAPSSSTGGALATAAAFRSPYRNRTLSWDFMEEGRGNGQLGLDRLTFNVKLDPLQLSLGRLPVNYSVTSIFTPNDFFAPFAATAINKIYKPGVDALRLNLALGQLSALELCGVLGSDADGVPGWRESALLLRASTVLWQVQWALLGGKLAERWVAGASLQGELGPLGIRGEGHVGFPDTDGDGTLDCAREEGARPRRALERGDQGHCPREIHGRASLGLDYRFEWRNAQLAVEALYQSDGAWDTAGYLSRLTALYPDDLPYLGRLYVGAAAGGEILPILRLQLVGLVNAGDGSGIGMLSLSHSLADEADLIGGLLVPWGARGVSLQKISPPRQQGAGSPPTFSVESELGLAPVVVFFETRFYF
jgi:hypothetical protein